MFTNGEALYDIEQDSFGTMWIKPDDKPPKRPIDTNASVNKVTLMDLHERYGHISFDTLKTLPGGQKYLGKTVPRCEACITGKSIKLQAKAHTGSNGRGTQIRSKQPLERLHADLIGPFSKEWLGKKYVLTMMDDYSRYCIAIPIKAKSNTKEMVKEWVKLMENQTSKKVQSIQADWGGEFHNNDLEKWCKKRGVELKETVPHHSETNATIERLNRTLQDMARTAMIAAKIKGLWGDAIQWAAYVNNRIPHKTLNASPVEVLFGKNVDRTNLRPFGQTVMIHLYKDQRTGNDRMAPRATRARIIGTTKTHRIYQTLLDSGKRVLAKDPKPINKATDNDKKEENSEWLAKPIQDLEDIAEGRTGHNYDWHCPVKEGCSEGTHEENHQSSQNSEKSESSPDSPGQQLIQEQRNHEPPAAPSKPTAPEPRQSERMGRNLTSWEDRIKQGLAREIKSKNQPIHRVGHDEDHPTDEQARSHSTKAHQWAKARQTEREKLQKYGVYTIVQKVPTGIHPI